jgi:hypothetical protein
LHHFPLSRLTSNSHYRIEGIQVECGACKTGLIWKAALMSLRLMRWMKAELRTIAFKVRDKAHYETQIQFQSQRIAQRIWRICHPLPLYGRNLRGVAAKVDRVTYRKKAAFIPPVSFKHSQARLASCVRLTYGATQHNVRPM